MKILYLDIDGVLNSQAYDLNRDRNEQTNIDETRLPLVKEIVDKTGAKIVLTSTWRSHWNKEETACDDDGRYINRLFAKYGLAIYDKTPELGRPFLRKDEIKAWLSEHTNEVERFAILDDYKFGWGELTDHCVFTNPTRGLGLEEEHVARAIELLN